jgi:multidrug efflux system outer membrane protein
MSQPLFTGGRLKNNLRLAEETQNETEAAYRKTILSALRDVSDALIACRKAREIRRAQAGVAADGREMRRLAQLRYDNGRTGYIEVLTSEEALQSAEMALANDRQQEALSMVQLYSALGGGWK